jgi:hypothetical protein
LIEKEVRNMLRQSFLFKELESTAIELAILVGQLELVENAKKEANQDFKERIDLLKLQIKNAARTINEGMRDGLKGVRVSGEDKGEKPPMAPAGYEPVPEGKSH